MTKDIEVERSEEVGTAERASGMAALHAMYLPHDIAADLAGNALQLSDRKVKGGCC